MTTTDFALRPAVVRGTCAHDSANGAAAKLEAFAVATVLLVAVAVPASSRSAAAAPPSSQRRLCIELSSVEFSAPEACSSGRERRR